MCKENSFRLAVCPAIKTNTRGKNYSAKIFGLKNKEVQNQDTEFSCLYW